MPLEAGRPPTGKQGNKSGASAESGIRVRGGAAQNDGSVTGVSPTANDTESSTTCCPATVADVGRMITFETAIAFPPDSSILEPSVVKGTRVISGCPELANHCKSRPSQT